MFKKKTSSPDIDRAVAQGVSFELTLAEWTGQPFVDIRLP